MILLGLMSKSEGDPLRSLGYGSIVGKPKDRRKKRAYSLRGGEMAADLSISLHCPGVFAWLNFTTRYPVLIRFVLVNYRCILLRMVCVLDLKTRNLWHLHSNYFNMLRVVPSLQNRYSPVQIRMPPLFNIKIPCRIINPQRVVTPAEEPLGFHHVKEITGLFHVQFHFLT